MKVAWCALSAIILSLFACAQDPVPPPVREPDPVLEFARDLSLNKQPISGTTYSSSTQLYAQWEAPDEAVDHYRLAYQDAVTEKAIVIMCAKTPNKAQSSAHRNINTAKLL